MGPTRARPAPAIRRLSPDAGSSVRSSSEVASFTTILQMLITNSLEACATGITATVDIPGESLRVSDNGRGIRPQDLESLVGTERASSKCTPRSGDSLVMIGTSCTLDIRSRATGELQSFTKVVQSGQQVQFTESAMPATGTVVEVRDIFNRSPVRRSLSVSSRDLQRAKVVAVARRVALENPQLSLSLVDASGSGEGRELVRKTPQPREEDVVKQICGVEVFAKMEVVECEFEGCLCYGYLSPPSSTCGHHSQEWQFITCSAGMALADAEELHALINDAYLKCFQLLQRRKVTSKDESSGLRCSVFPMYVLHMERAGESAHSFDGARHDQLQTQHQLRARSSAHSCIAHMLLTFLEGFGHAVPDGVLRSLRAHHRTIESANDPGRQAKARTFLGTLYSREDAKTWSWKRARLQGSQPLLDGTLLTSAGMTLPFAHSSSIQHAPSVSTGSHYDNGYPPGAENSLLDTTGNAGSAVVDAWCGQHETPSHMHQLAQLAPPVGASMVPLTSDHNGSGGDSWHVGISSPINHHEAANALGNDAPHLSSLANSVVSNCCSLGRWDEEVMSVPLPRDIHQFDNRQCVQPWCGDDFSSASHLDDYDTGGTQHSHTRAAGSLAGEEAEYNSHNTHTHTGDGSRGTYMPFHGGKFHEGGADGMDCSENFNFNLRDLQHNHPTPQQQPVTLTSTVRVRVLRPRSPDMASLDSGAISGAMIHSSASPQQSAAVNVCSDTAGWQTLPPPLSPLSPLPSPALHIEWGIQSGGESRPASAGLTTGDAIQIVESGGGAHAAESTEEWDGSGGDKCDAAVSVVPAAGASSGSSGDVLLQSQSQQCSGTGRQDESQHAAPANAAEDSRRPVVEDSRQLVAEPEDSTYQQVPTEQEQHGGHFAADAPGEQDSVEEEQRRCPSGHVAMCSLPQAAISHEALTNVDLRGAQVICQLDRKYIVLRSGDLLMCADQHAVHERIRLEALEKALCPSYGDSCSNGASSDSVTSAFNASGGSALQQRALAGAWLMDVTLSDADLIERNMAHLQAWGFSIQVPSPQQQQELPELGSLVRVSVTHIPVVCGVQLSRTDLLEMVRQCGSYGTNAAPVRGAIPTTIHHILKYKACHGAIRFGDLLSQEQCCELVHGLSQCRLPFQCAHGRPSMVPLAHMQLYAPGQA